MAKKFINKITIVGCGPGSKKYLTGYALQQINSAEVLIGSRRLLSLFPDADLDTYVLNNNYKLLLTRIVSLSKRKRVVVLVSGDPGFFSYAKLIIDKIGIENCEVIPGISSVQLAFAKIGRTWNDACFISLQGRSGKLASVVKKIIENEKVAILTDNANSVKLIARKLIDSGLKSRKIYVCENLSLEKERIREFDVSSIMKIRVSDLTVIIILDES
ncbi:precorrin-6B methylase 1 [Candidatus Scalindua japonica]|uniref:Precorrin-6B methylase 1 n=1 Tax=Candidatus Scalindua japonica TaxID=1284222 RepID=A0A286TUJ7_9BACT|nr:precorrin-6y C5,15-methyltransferase (decarboxylating) subunit CbiE [Candidatus Scalindua japonica]GAX59546.1 precorrin-6B methylase 1 [Candidatus Scalindua japonica]